MTNNNQTASIITVCFNARASIEDTILSVCNQKYSNIEHVVVDGGSTDGTVDIIRALSRHLSFWSSEPDAGIYAAMNKGLHRTTGEVVGFLNAGDMFARSDAVAKLMAPFSVANIDAVFGDVAMFEGDDPTRVRRFYSTPRFRPWHLRLGYMPPHPSFFVRRSLLLNEGGFDEDFRIGGDYELMLRLFLNKAALALHVPGTMVAFRLGGISNGSVKKLIRLNQEFLQACRKNSVWSHPALMAMRYPAKASQLLRRPSANDMAEYRAWFEELRRFKSVV